ncbi:MAG: hypothetical protein Q8N99_07590 [Nanoarchaeota archaeon]|nr:hypothetical protein [Nanoarchaeota archaeon]
MESVRYEPKYCPEERLPIEDIISGYSLFKLRMVFILASFLNESVAKRGFKVKPLEVDYFPSEAPRKLEYTTKEF